MKKILLCYNKEEFTFDKFLRDIKHYYINNEYFFLKGITYYVSFRDIYGDPLYYQTQISHIVPITFTFRFANVEKMDKSIYILYKKVHKGINACDWKLCRNMILYKSKYEDVNNFLSKLKDKCYNKEFFWLFITKKI